MVLNNCAVKINDTSTIWVDVAFDGNNNSAPPLYYLVRKWKLLLLWKIFGIGIVAVAQNFIYTLSLNTFSTILTNRKERMSIPCSIVVYCVQWFLNEHWTKTQTKQLHKTMPSNVGAFCFAIYFTLDRIQIEQRETEALKQITNPCLLNGFFLPRFCLRAPLVPRKFIVSRSCWFIAFFGHQFPFFFSSSRRLCVYISYSFFFFFT